MDSLSDSEVKGIWDRVKRYINPENLKANSREELAREISQQMQLAGGSGKQGSMDGLLRNGFAERISRFDDVQESYVEAVTPEGKKFVAEQRLKRPERKVSPDKNKVRYNNKRTTVRTGKGFKSFKPENIKVTNSTWKGKSAFYVTNVRTGKRVSWGLIK